MDGTRAKLTTDSLTKAFPVSVMSLWSVSWCMFQGDHLRIFCTIFFYGHDHYCENKNFECMIKMVTGFFFIKNCS